MQPVLPNPQPDLEPRQREQVATPTPEQPGQLLGNEPEEALPSAPGLQFLPTQGSGFTQDPEEEEEEGPLVRPAIPLRPVQDQAGLVPEPPPLPQETEPGALSQLNPSLQEPPMEEPPLWLEEPEWEPDATPTPLQVEPAKAVMQISNPAPTIQVASAALASSQAFPWEQFVAEAGRGLGQGIQALLKQATPVEWKEGRLEVQCGNPIAFQRRKEELEAVATGLAGLPVKLQFQEGRQNTANSIGNREREAKRQHQEELQQQALAHPLVQEALTRFPGALVQEIIIEEKDNDV